MRRNEPNESELVVLGGGLVGLLTALFVSESTSLNVCVYADDAPEPRTDSQRNHAWLQSGLLYVGADIVAARHMYLSGRMMHVHLGFRPPSARGVFRYDAEGPVDAFFAHAKQIRLESEIRQLSEREAKVSLGKFFEKGKLNFEVPDSPFNISALMSAARDRAKDRGVSFRVDRIRVERNEAAPCGYTLRSSHGELRPRITVVCAGSATPAILDCLGLDHPLVVNRSSLLVLPSAEGMRAPLLADRSSQIAVVRHGISPSQGRIVVGNRDRTLVDPGNGLERNLTKEEHEQLMNCVPLDLRTPGIRATACHKTDCRRKDGKATVDYWVESFSEYPGLIFATPGKATMAYHTAKLVRDKVMKANRRNGFAQSNANSNVVPPGTDWHEPILSHFHPAFDEMDDTSDF
jgi:glycine/D-amino acid oxidase-like deaminating enzyme